MNRKIVSSFVIFLIMTLVILATGCNQQKVEIPTIPYEVISEDISWKIGETTVYATITRPDSEGTFPSVIFVAGSGPTDRDWNSPLIPGTNGSARLLAEELARQGYVTLRYDKRFAGPHAQDNLPHLIGKLSLDSHVEEIAGGIVVLRDRADVNPHRIYALANSEGTIHAMNYQINREPKLAGLILAAPPGQSMADLMHNQLAAQLESVPGGAEMLAGYDRLMADFVAEKPVVPDPDLPDSINNLVLNLTQPANLPFMREIQTINPAEMLKNMDAPVMIIIGKKDIQVDWQVDGVLSEEAVESSGNVLFIYPENANHVLKYELKPRAELTANDALEYNATGRVLDEESLKAIIDWLNNAGK